MDAIPSARFRAIERTVCSLNNRIEVRVLALGRIEGRRSYRDARRRMMLLAGSGGDARHKPLRGDASGARRGIGCDDRELVSAPARPEVRLTESSGNCSCDAPNQRITGGVPFLVVQLLEAVDVHEQQ